ncbi:unnamed protein product [Blepharisma stoltei]|uniref:C2H2-type domain-containing protein n=1 Tax=Blepharisma stoltei TaxID=1481888 RepID=A0AAU9ILF9_9CILI|nr:unnamed protein product [Blepharisma stoltei]
MDSAEAKAEKKSSKKRSTFKLIKDLSKKEFTLRGFTFRQIHQDFYQCVTCSEELNYALIPAHTKNHQKPNEKASKKLNPNFTEILEYEVPNKGLVYVKTLAKKPKNKSSKFVELNQTQNEEEYCSDNSNSEASQGSSDPYSEAADTENSSEDSPKIKTEATTKKVSEETIRKKINLSDDDSLTSSSGDSTRNWTADIIDRERNVDFYNCSCGAKFHSYRKFKTHCSMKKSTCQRCGEISFCRAAMKSHYVICLTQELREIKWGQKSMIPHPIYLRGVEEAIRKTYAVMKKDIDTVKEEEKKEEVEYTWLPRKKRSKYQ